MSWNSERIIGKWLKKRRNRHQIILATKICSGHPKGIGSTGLKWIRKKIGPIATPDKLQFSPGLPKTRSGKIMRRILRKIASKEEDQLGDTSTLADPSVVKSLIDGSKNI